MAGLALEKQGSSRSVIVEKIVKKEGRTKDVPGMVITELFNLVLAFVFGFASVS